MLSRYFLPSVLFVIFALGVQTTQAEDASKNQPLTVLITGANRGLGLEYAKQYRASGHHVIGTARKPEEATELKETGAEVAQLDVTSDEDIANLAKSLKGKRIDILINNAGYLGRKQTREDMTLSFSVNTLGPLFVSRALIPNLKLSDTPKIINISSRAGRLTDGTGRMTGYALSKTAVNMVTRNLHSQLAKEGFIVISLAPGRNQTAMGGKGAPLKPEKSVSKIIALIAKLDATHSGGFWYYDGTELHW